MIHGIGTDILALKRIQSLGGEGFDDPFFRRTFTDEEFRQGLLRSDPHIYFASRFAAKEAVFKSLQIDGNHIRLSDIEIGVSDCGSPSVMLCGRLKKIADDKGIQKIHLSLSWEDGHVLAFAVAER